MSCTVGCPYEGEVSSASVAHLAGLMKQIGVQRVDVADTIGTGTPLKVQRAGSSTRPSATRPRCWPAPDRRCRESGCPYAKGATGNVATEDVVYMLHGMGIATGIDLDKLTLPVAPLA